MATSRNLFSRLKRTEGSDGFFMRKFRTDKEKYLVDTSGQWQVLDVQKLLIGQLN